MRDIRPDATEAQLQAERDERGQLVRDYYKFEQVGPVTWVVSHPADPDRTYVVDMAQRTCSCPDFECFCKERNLDCKHVASVIPTYEQETGRTVERRMVYEPDTYRENLKVRWNYEREARARLGGIVQPDPDDPYKLNDDDKGRTRI